MAAFLKLDDIKGEIVLDTTPPELVTVCTWDDAGFKDDALTNGGYSEDGANRFTTGGGGDSLTDAGLVNNSLHQGADVWTSGIAISIEANELTNSDHSCCAGYSDNAVSNADALVQQVNGTIGYEMQAGMNISPDAKGNTTGTIAAYNVMGSGVPVENHCTGYCFDGGSSVQENIFAPVNVLRSDNHF